MKISIWIFFVPRFVVKDTVMLSCCLGMEDNLSHVRSVLSIPYHHDYSKEQRHSDAYPTEETQTKECFVAASMVENGSIQRTGFFIL